MVDAKSIYDTIVNTNDDNVGEGSEYKWKDVWDDLNYLQFIQTEQMPSSAIGKKNSSQKASIELCLEQRSIMFLRYDGAWAWWEKGHCFENAYGD